MRVITIALILLLFPSLAIAGVIDGTVVKIADGDTITVLDSNKVQHRIRIAGIDAPEKGQPFGNASRKRLADLVARMEVRVEFNKYDRYDHIVGKAFVTPPDCPKCAKKIDVGLAQITTGMAWWYRKFAHEQSARTRGVTRMRSRKPMLRGRGCCRKRTHSHRGSSGGKFDECTGCTVWKAKKEDGKVTVMVPSRSYANAAGITRYWELLRDSEEGKHKNTSAFKKYIREEYMKIAATIPA